jgi:hypothetical protein
VTLDPISGQALVFGGFRDGTATSRLIALDLGTGETMLLSESTHPALARAQHAAAYDPVARRLYVYGGTRGDVLLTDTVALDLGGLVVDVLDPGGPASPGLSSQARLILERRAGRLWLAPGPADDLEPTLRPWALDLAYRQWAAWPSLTALPLDPAGSSATLTRDAPAQMTLLVDAEAALPFEPHLLSLVTDDPRVSLIVKDARGAVVATDSSVALERSLLVLGEPGAMYRVTAAAGSDLPAGLPVGYIYRDALAELVPEAEQTGLFDVTGLTVLDDVVLVAHGMSVHAFALGASGEIQPAGSIFLGGLVQEITPCGKGQACAVLSHGQRNLVVLTLGAAGPAKVGSLALPGICRSLGMAGARAYVGCGSRVHAVSLVTPETPQVVGAWEMGSLVSEVKAGNGWLAVGLASGRVKVYRLGSSPSPELVAEVATKRKPVHLALAGRLLHVAESQGAAWALCAAGLRCGFGSQVEVFALDEAAGLLTPAGEYQGVDVRSLHGAALGSRLARPTLNGFELLRATALP